jgi:hypothetical protein
MARMAAAYEKLGLFYLGKRVDLATGQRLDEPFLYDAKDLVTHAVCVGMTGSGKTGLGIGLIEEAAIDGVPVLAIDPKGDLSNLLLTFPQLRPQDFAPWVDPATAASRGTTVDALAAEQAAAWATGLAEWDQTGERIARLREAARVRVYTPGSRAGVPLALLGSLRAPEGDDEDASAQVTSLAASLLSLAGLGELGPHSREQVFLAAILSQPAPAGRPADFSWLVESIQRPNFYRVGVLDLETFVPAKERQELALRFNSVLASPGFDVWLAGEPLDAGSMFYDAQGRPRVAIVSIAHLGEGERMLVVSLLLNAILAWTRKQPGTGSLRAMLYMDEVFGYLPPVSNPPSKLPLLTLLKQARAFGVGVVLATQNPVDLDYKALSNTGTWFLGKLQTERDKARVLDGLESLTASVDRSTIDRALSSLRGRTFFVHNVHEPGPVVIETRWALSYLRGPMSREELRRATAGSADSSATSAAAARAATPVTAPAAGPPATTTATRAARPVLPANVRELFLGPADEASTYVPTLYGSARLQFSDAKRGVDTVQDVHATVPFSDGVVPIDWEQAAPIEVPPEGLLTQPASAQTAFAPLPPAALDAKRYATWTKEFTQWLLRTQRLTLYSAPTVKLMSKQGETERDFRIRLQHAGREATDDAVQKLRDRYAPKVARLGARLQAARDALVRESQQAQQQKTQTAVSFGATVIGALLGGKALSMSTLGRATTAIRGVGRSMKETQDIGRAEAKVQETETELKSLENEMAEEVAALTASAGTEAAVETLEIAPKRGAVEIRLVALVWKPAD